MIPVGATVTVHGHRNRDATRFEVKTERVTWNGRTFDVYPDRK
jgi:phage-related protein